MKSFKAKFIRLFAVSGPNTANHLLVAEKERSCGFVLGAAISWLLGDNTVSPNNSKAGIDSCT